MGVTIREKKKGSGEWWIFVHHRGERTSVKAESKAEAEEAKKEIERQLILNEAEFFERRKADPDSEFRVIAGLWVEGYIREVRKESTYERYKQLLKDYINPAIGKLDIRAINRGKVRDLLLNVSKKGLSKSTVSVIRDVVSGVFNYAIDEELITENPCRGILKRLNLNRKKRPRLNPFTRDEVSHFLNTCQKHFPAEYPFFLFAFRTGMRLGELLGLEWSDIDWHGKFVEVSKSFRRTIGSTKTGAYRRVDLSDQLIEVMRRLHTKRKREAIEAGKGEPIQIIFHRNGDYIPQNTVRRTLDRILVKAGLRRIRFHDIRHTYVSLLLSSGVTPNYVMEQAGHTSIQITVDVYGDYIPQSDKAEVNTLDEKPNLIKTELR